MEFLRPNDFLHISGKYFYVVGMGFDDDDEAESIFTHHIQIFFIRPFHKEKTILTFFLHENLSSFHILIF